ncbi:MAG: hypothetical protein HQL57_01160 [Magnetococcales bacterium]|nr:hypothetical protein [Magnetococcales bacterium]
MDDRVMVVLRAELGRPRELTIGMVEAMTGAQGAGDPLLALGSQRVAQLPEYEQELLLSPLFTPGWEERARYEAVLPAEGLQKAEVVSLAGRLVAEGVTGLVVHGDEERSLVIPEVVLERYLRLLHLDHPLDPEVARLLRENLAGGELDQALNLSRQPVWQGERGVALLRSLVATMAAVGRVELAKILFLTEFVRFSRVGSVAVLVNHLNDLLDVYRQEGDLRPVFNVQLAKYQSKAIHSALCGEEVKRYRVELAGAILADLAGTPTESLPGG